VLDLDETLVDTSELRSLRAQRKWNQAVQRVSTTRLYPGMAELLEQLNNLAIPWCVVTTSVSFYANAVLAHHGLVPGARVAYHDARPKPHPEGVLRALSQLQAEPHNAIGIGDAATDCGAYSAAGIRAIGAGWSASLEDAPWDQILAEPCLLRALLG
jgi:HAD superfamily hydrolase (TIGR01509 family)